MDTVNWLGESLAYLLVIVGGIGFGLLCDLIRQVGWKLIVVWVIISCIGIIFIFVSFAVLHETGVLTYITSILPTPK